MSKEQKTEGFDLKSVQNSRRVICLSFDIPCKLPATLGKVRRKKMKERKKKKEVKRFVRNLLHRASSQLALSFFYLDKPSIANITVVNKRATWVSSSSSSDRLL